MALLEGGPAIELVGPGETSPRNVVVSGGYAYWTAAGTTEDGGTITRRRLALPLEEPAEEILGSEVMNKPEGLAIGGGWLFWTDFEAGEVRRVMLDESGSAAGPSELIAPGQNRPFRIATNDAFTCWTNEGTLMQQQGSVWCWIAGTGSLLEVGPDQSTPREIAVTADAVYWADFGSGQILRARWDGAAFAAAEVLAEGQAYPNGIFVDGGDVYWTNRGDGAVRVLRAGASAPEDVATGQDNPGTILVTGDEIFWINEGGLDGAGGVILRRVK
jgi:sugar lactone lactonase YvrE